ncbi:MAG: type III-A CRISPR-associated RAMP protein Csm3 [Methylomonas sp.]|nr:type III-A CRISPR-associated RAMP protein Csm3 [Methylomonas sp.]PPD21137.1 MAG: type III-A CRISPR-associated RAMP protein Csm3 [Methylomonas sp.]PPD27571.1 MAG: type III-A CRISPR-associated RAMP protein Csm3 [Methylomonas sp.]PPD39567.1 MAG: type III-A CRISPR-associated RAMP protein Csm3 [Methylomonas sp.]PPD55818.1 MAG: type III-A CRISPR-associated RAMP protein Csm3 [Methylomonas sp.]
MQLTQIQKLSAKIELLSGLHIGSGNTEIHIGGTDNPVIKNPITQQPYIPGSSIKGKMRSLLEWHLGVVGIAEGHPLSFKHIGKLSGKTQDQAKNLLKLFGGAPDSSNDQTLIEEIGPTRLAFWDCSLDSAWVEDMDKKNLLLTETKMENMIDRIRGVAEYPRNTERVPATARFDFNLTLRVHDGEDLLATILQGLKLLELTGLGGSGSRGYGKIQFTGLTLDGNDIQTKLQQIDLQEAA